MLYFLTRIPNSPRATSRSPHEEHKHANTKDNADRHKIKWNMYIYTSNERSVCVRAFVLARVRKREREREREREKMRVLEIVRE